MELHLNWIAIALAAISTMVVGTVWYLPAVFGRRWMNLTGVDPNKPKSRALAYGGSFVASFVTAIVLAAAASFVNPLLAASVLWLGFTAARMAVHFFFDGRSLKIWLIDSAYELVTVLVMAAIIGLLGH